MRFVLTDEQEAFADAVDELVAAGGGVDVPRSWAEGSTAPGRTLWARFSELGLTGLRVPEDEGGLGGTPSDVAVVFERLGYHAVPGPYLESIAFLPHLVGPDLTQEIADGSAVVTASIAPHVPAANDADFVTHRFVIAEGRIFPASVAQAIPSLAATRTLAVLTPEGEGREVDGEVLQRAVDEAALANAAFLIGAGERLLDEAVSYTSIRTQFGRPVGGYQAVQHALADVRVALSFARPLVQAASLSLGSPTSGRDVSAAKVAAAGAATRAARTSLQMHGAIGYTAEHHLGLWVTVVPALVGAWGTPAFHRARIARSILAH
ncbi:acyl-CoA dehydrogenase family protein [uncultured Microbacterium sp.]|uniref:acyl-CoA dehydrogenase family protein n=1 Tax=uncultured Microbacterium sp. TaxID=191216 RepID=UPI0035C9D2EC